MDMEKCDCWQPCIFSGGQITSYNSQSQSSTPGPHLGEADSASQFYNNNIREDIDEVRGRT